VSDLSTNDRTHLALILLYGLSRDGPAPAGEGTCIPTVSYTAVWWAARS